MGVGHVAKAIATGGLVWSEAPQKAMTILEYLLSIIPGWPMLPVMVQDAILWFIAGGVAWVCGYVVYWIPNTTVSAPQPWQRPSTLGLQETQP